MPVFNYVIQNPPYSGSLHLNFLKLSLDLVEKSKGVFSIVNPSTWLIQVKPYGSYRKEGSFATELRNRIEHHTSKVIIENYNNEFRTGLNMPFSVVKGDFANEYKQIEFECCGEKSLVDTINDCNLVGNYETILSIFSKIEKVFGKNMMSKHIYIKNSKVDKNTRFAAIAKVMRGGCGDPRFSDEWFIDGLYRCYYYHCFNDKEPISKEPHHLLCTGYTYSNPKYKDELALNIYGTQEELENFKDFVFNNDLCKFLNICIIQDMNRCEIEKYVPWINYKTNTTELYQKLNLRAKEIELIETTIQRYKINSKWFFRYLEGNKQTNK